MSLESLGKMLLAAALVIAIVGGLLYLLGRVLGLQGLPGDIRIERDGFSCFFPIATSILVSVVLTVLVTLYRYFFKG